VRFTANRNSKMLLGLRTVIYAAPDLAAAKAWYTTLLGKAPYFDEPFYVGFNVGGYELGLDPNASSAPGANGAVAYWGIASLDAALKRAEELHVAVLSAAQDVGGGIRVATIGDPAGNVVGLIENPHFTLP
jgi:predicted enzyme related to lactoylglutathione lyase